MHANLSKKRDLISGLLTMAGAAIAAASVYDLLSIPASDLLQVFASIAAALVVNSFQEHVFLRKLFRKRHRDEGDKP